MTKVTYKGPARGAARLAQVLQEEGLEVQYQPPIERRIGGIETALEVVVLWVGDKVANAVVGESVDSLVKKAVAKFKERIGDAPCEVDIEDDE